ncbi:glycosyltransferase family 4 protein [Sphaerospermopsis sp. FACHB-1094]|uniref:glycosyltransferase family 4 protein n=1 Tax=Sphaerospermopsis sp. FACHB-1094 TaxID=2692861 RepID=UPI0016893BFC|nr:glycosyltransferase family 4 protein [Sphaerospermopsis sp. FACHB-1094]MBD2133994.1 glycosyltransferase family 4 protein [Sphaerospermopsis sp. FACHB-1094]
MMKSSLRILTVADTPCDPNSGAAGTVYYTNQALREIGHEVDEIWADDLGPRRIAHGNLHSLLEQPRAYRRAVMKAIATKDYDVIQMSQPQAYLAAKALKQGGFKGLVINRSHGVELRVDEVLPYWYQKLGVPESRFPGFLTAGLRKLLQRQWHEVVKYCDGVIVTCEDDSHCLVSKLNIDADKIKVIHHGVPEAFFNTPTQSYSLERHQQLLYVGQSAFFKAPLILAAIINKILLSNPDVTMTWVTPVNSHNYLKSLLNAQILSRVVFLDWQPQEKLIALYDSSGIFIFPSFIEGAGKTSLEALSRGLCVVASNQGGMKDYIKSGENGFLCEVGNSEEFVNRIECLLENLEFATCLREKAVIDSRSYTWKNCADKAVDYYQILLEISRNG